MDPNLLHWKTEGESFLHRLRTWLNLLAPSLLLSSNAEILKAHNALLEQQLKEKNDPAVILSLSSVHADSGAPLPLIYRPPAYLPISGPLVVGSLLHHSRVRPALLWQFLLQSYNAGFNYANRNTSGEQGAKLSLKQPLLIAGTISYATLGGAFPQIFINGLRIRSSLLQTCFKSLLPVPLSAALAFFSVLTIRSTEPETGIQVFDSNGNAVGVSKAAGAKAVWETGLSRAVLFGTTTAVPNLLVLLLRRIRFFQRNSLLVTPCHYISIAVVLGLMIPVSFSFFPQLGTIKREEVEEELLDGVDGKELYYHRGL